MCCWFVWSFLVIMIAWKSWWLHPGACPEPFREPPALGFVCCGWLCRVLWLFFPTRGHWGSRTSCGFPGLSEGQAFGVYLLGTNCVPPVSRGERGQIQNLVALFAQLGSLYFPFKNKPRYFSIWLETTLTPHRVAASCCKLQIWFLGIGCRGKKRYNCSIWAFWNVNVSKKCARVYSSLKLFIQPRVLCIQGRGRGIGADGEELCARHHLFPLPACSQAGSH